VIVFNLAGVTGLEPAAYGFGVRIKGICEILNVFEMLCIKGISFFCVGNCWVKL